MEHGRADKEGRFNRIGFSGNRCVKRNRISTGRFGIDNLIDSLFFSHSPGFAVRTFACGYARNLKARTGSYDQAAGLIDIAVHRVGNADKLIKLHVGSVLRGIPAIVDTALIVGIVKSNALKRFRTNASDFLDLFRCVFARKLFKHAKSGSDRLFFSVCKNRFAAEFEFRFKVLVFNKTNRGSFFVSLYRTKRKCSGTVGDNKNGSTSVLAEVSLCKRRTV